MFRTLLKSKIHRVAVSGEHVFLVTNQDVGHGFALKDVERGARLTLAGSIILTLVVWAIALGVS